MNYSHIKVERMVLSITGLPCSDTGIFLQSNIRIITESSFLDPATETPRDNCLLSKMGTLLVKQLMFSSSFASYGCQMLGEKPTVRTATPE